MATATDLAYASGLFDGEGTIDIKSSVRMAVKMTDEEPVEFLKGTFGGRVYQWKDTDTGRPTYEWRASGKVGVIEAIAQMMPYIVGKRRQLEVVKSYFEYSEFYGYAAEVKAIASSQLRGLRNPRVVPITLDIETMGLEPESLPMLSCSYLYGDEESDILVDHITNPRDDTSLAIRIRDRLEAAPYTIGWNSSRFDIPYINTRLRLRGERPMFLGSHEDADVVFDRFFGNKRRTSLVNAANQLKVTDEKVHKTPIDWPTWHRALDCDPDALAYVVEHAKMDVILTKRVYNVITK